MRRFPVLKYELSAEQVMDHAPFLADLALVGSIAEVARLRGTSVDTVYYHLHILNKELGPVYQAQRGRKAKVTNLGHELLSYFQPASKGMMKCGARIEGMMQTKRHALCGRRFPDSAKEFSGADLYPEIKNMKQKPVIECLKCGAKVMVRVTTCVNKWIKLHDADINGLTPFFKLQYLSDALTLIRS